MKTSREPVTLETLESVYLDFVAHRNEIVDALSTIRSYKPMFNKGGR